MMTSPNTMKALVVYAPGDYRLENVDIPKAQAGEIVIKVEACGICAGDVKTYHGASKIWGGNGNVPYIKTPVIPGHEFIGNIVEIGDGVDESFSIGDRVISEQIVPCWSCRYCINGQYWMCQKHDLYGFQSNVNGGMAEYMKFPKQSIKYKVPKELPLESAVLIEPYACSKHCVDRARIISDDTVVLSGAGTLGLGMIGAIKQVNPKRLIVLDMIDSRLNIAKSFGADITLNPSKCDIKKIIYDYTDGYGCDTYIEATGHPSSVLQGLEIIRKMGTFVEFSVFKDLVTADWSIIGDSKELNIYGAHLSPYCYEYVINNIGSEKLPTNGVVTHKYPLSEWDVAFKTAENSQEALKVIVIP